jgi:hypothetical protein
VDAVIPLPDHKTTWQFHFCDSLRRMYG